MADTEHYLSESEIHPIDIVENLRIKKSLKNKGFIPRVFTADEILHSKKFKNKSTR